MEHATMVLERVVDTNNNNNNNNNNTLLQTR